VDWIHLAQDRVQRQALVITVMNINGDDLGCRAV
jgi:hypothetical protein